jgi:hypothetical protein
MGATLATNYMSNYGMNDKQNGFSLKEEYFKNGEKDSKRSKEKEEKSEMGVKYFRVRNNSRRNSINDPEKEKEKVKEV